MSAKKNLTPYAQKLLDPRWQRKRLEVMQRDDFTCRVCSATTKTLNVHHIRYLRGRAPWDYKEFYFVTLCEDCHKAEEIEIQGTAVAIPANEAKNEPVFDDTQRGVLMRRDYEVKQKLKVPGLSEPAIIDLLMEVKAINEEMRLAGILPVLLDDFPKSTYKPKPPTWKQTRP